MSKTYAALYLPQEYKEPAIPNPKNVERNKGILDEHFDQVSEWLTSSEMYQMAKNLDLQSSSEFVQSYAVAALTDILNGQTVTNQTMLDSLFNTYAPALNAGLAQTGYNSLMEMRNAVKSGNINVANFVQGFSNGLSIVQDMNDRVEYSKYGEEVPIDVVSECEYTYNSIKAHQKLDAGESLSSYISDLDPVKINITAHVKNKNAELWNINDFSNKIIDLQSKKTEIIFRIGKSIYENCVIKEYIPTITNIYNISFEITIEFDYYLNTKSQEYGNKRIMNPTRLIGDFDIYNTICKEVYGGIIMPS